MHRAVALVAAFAFLPLAGGFAPDEAPLEATGLAASPAPLPSPSAPEAQLDPAPATPAPCAPAIDVRFARDHAALSWPECAGVERWTLHRGPSVAELAPLVELDHASHVDVDVGDVRTLAYAVQPEGGPVGPATLVILSAG